MPGLRALLGLLIAALALHAAVLGWLASQWRAPEVLRPMAAPLFTRQVVVAAPSPGTGQPPRCSACAATGCQNCTQTAPSPRRISKHCS